MGAPSAQRHRQPGAASAGDGGGGRHVYPKSDTTTLVFQTERRKGSYASTIVVTAADMKRVGNRAPDLVTDAQFALLPAIIGGTEVVDAVKGAVKSTEADCVESGRKRPYCESRSITKSDQFMQEWLRKYRNPKKDSPSGKRLADAETLVAFLRSRGIDKNLEQWLLFRSIAANELSLEIHGNEVSVYDPIYGVSDAILDNSGLSFGAHQIDIGANSPKEVALFWDVLSAYLLKHRDGAVEEAKAMQACVNLPMRLETLRALDVTCKVAPGIGTGGDALFAYHSQLRARDGRSRSYSSPPTRFSLISARI
jgi:hypothetical protein